MLTLTRFEQSALLLEIDSSRLVVDPGTYSGPASLEKMAAPNAVLVSHKHADHFSPANLEQLAAPVYTVSETAAQAEGRGIELHVHAAGDKIQIGTTPFTVTYTNSDHGPHVGMVENVGFLIDAGGKKLYFLGDMYTPSILPQEPFDVMLIPIGNRNYTFGVEEAFAFIQQLDWHGLTIPVHYHGVEETAERFAKVAGDYCQVNHMRQGESITL